MDTLVHRIMDGVEAAFTVLADAGSIGGVACTDREAELQGANMTPGKAYLHLRMAAGTPIEQVGYYEQGLLVVVQGRIAFDGDIDDVNPDDVRLLLDETYALMDRTMFEDRQWGGLATHCEHALDGPQLNSDKAKAKLGTVLRSYRILFHYRPGNPYSPC